MKHRLSPMFRRGHATVSGTLRGGVAIAPGGSAFPGVLGVAAVLGLVAGVPGGDEDRGPDTAVGDFGGVITGPAAGAGRTRGGRAGGVGEAGTALGCGLVLLCAPGWAGSAMYCCQLPNRSLRIARHQLALIRAFLSTAGRCFSASAFALRSGLASGARTRKSFGRAAASPVAGSPWRGRLLGRAAEVGRAVARAGVAAGGWVAMSAVAVFLLSPGSGPPVPKTYLPVPRCCGGASSRHCWGSPGLARSSDSANRIARARWSSGLPRTVAGLGRSGGVAETPVPVW